MPVDDLAPTDGVTRFRRDWRAHSPPSAEAVRELNHWREQLGRAGWIGVDAKGVGFGNLSRRLLPEGNAFVITGTQTGGQTLLCAHDYAVVTQVEVTANRVTAHGHAAPSSEAMTHWMAYAADARVGWVFHGHDAKVWRAIGHHALPLRALCTPRDVGYGTPAMADAVRDLMSPSGALPCLIAMLGHEDGVIALAESATAAGELLLEAQRLTS